MPIRPTAAHADAHAQPRSGVRRAYVARLPCAFAVGGASTSIEMRRTAADAARRARGARAVRTDDARGEGVWRVVRVWQPRTAKRHRTACFPRRGTRTGSASESAIATSTAGAATSASTSAPETAASLGARTASLAVTATSAWAPPTRRFGSARPTAGGRRAIAVSINAAPRASALIGVRATPTACCRRAARRATACVGMSSVSRGCTAALRSPAIPVAVVATMPSAPRAGGAASARVSGAAPDGLRRLTMTVLCTWGTIRVVGTPPLPHDHRAIVGPEFVASRAEISKSIGVLDPFARRWVEAYP